MCHLKFDICDLSFIATRLAALEALK